MDSLTYMQLLRRNRSFRRLWSGQVISELGNWFNFIAALGLVRVISNASPEVTTILLISRLVPFSLFAPLAGAFVDRWSRRRVMIAADFVRVLIALGFLLVRRPQDLWIAYMCTALLSFFGAFFEAAKNAAVPNITGERDLLAGNALMFSSRFLLMSLGAALGGWTSAHVGYQAAFVINAVSFLGSAYAPVATILAINVLWATGGGAINLISDRLGGVVFGGANGVRPDSAVAALYFAAGLGLFGGMMIARRVGAYFEFVGRTVGFIGWSLLIQGVIFALIGLMPTLWLACLLLLISRVLLGAEFAVQETLLMRLVPDNLRGRVSTTDRASEMLVWTFSTAIAGWSLYTITPRTLTIISGLLSATAGVAWLVLFTTRLVSLPRRIGPEERSTEQRMAVSSE